MPAYLVDTSALFKHYFPEPGTEKVERLFSEEENLAVSTLTEVELLSNLQRLHLVDHVIDGDQLDAVWTSFSLELASGVIRVVPVSAEVVEESVRLLLSRYVTPVDALQLATATSIEATLVSSDRKLNRLAGSLGLRVYDPCAEGSD